MKVKQILLGIGLLLFIFFKIWGNEFFKNIADIVATIAGIYVLVSIVRQEEKKFKKK